MAFPTSSRNISSRLQRRLRSRQQPGINPWLLGLGVGIVGTTVAAFWYRKAVPHSIVLAVDLSSPPPEVQTPSLFNIAAFIKPNHYDFIRVLEHAQHDKMVAGIMANVGKKENWNMAQAQEIREASEAGDSNTNYYLASGFDRIYVQPCGDVNLMGYKVNSPFLRGVFDRLGIQPQFVQRKEYKNAPNIFTHTAFTPEHRQSIIDVLTSMYETVINGISQGRKMTVDAVDKIMTQGPYTASQAQESGLVDELIYESEIIPLLKEGKRRTLPQIPTTTEQPQQQKRDDSTSMIAVSSNAHLPSSNSSSNPASPANVLPELLAPHLTRVVRFDRYAQTALAKLTKSEAALKVSGAPKIALLYGLGNVTTEKGSVSTPGAFHSSTLAKAIHNASKDPKVQVIVFRIDSPGGSYVAADTVYAALRDAKNAGKKIVVSMGSVAASGGYFAAAPADYIFANSTTITGSIGVFAGKFAMRKFLEDKVGVNFDSQQVGGGPTTGMFSMVDLWNSAQLKKMNEMMDRVYADFVAKVASGRHLSVETAESLAKGRVWTGEAAHRNGLIDECGGLHHAIQKARSMIPHHAVVEVIPKKKTLLQLIAQLTGAGDAENDDEPLFTSITAAHVLQSLVTNTVEDGVGLIEAKMMNQFISAIGVATGCGSMAGSVSASGSLHAADGLLGQAGLLDRQGKLIL